MVLAARCDERVEVRVGNARDRVPSTVPADTIVRTTRAGTGGVNIGFTRNGPELCILRGIQFGNAVVGVVEEAGTGVRPGDRLVASATFAEADCFHCRRDLHRFCEHGEACPALTIFPGMANHTRKAATACRADVP